MALPPPDPQFVLRGANDAVNTLCFHCADQEPELPILFSGSSDGLIHVWNLKTRRTERTLNGHGGKSVFWVKTLGSRNTLLSQGRDQNVCFWDLAEGRKDVTDTVCTENVGFCRCSLLKVAERRWLMAMPGKDLEEVFSEKIVSNRREFHSMGYFDEETTGKEKSKGLSPVTADKNKAEASGAE